MTTQRIKSALWWAYFAVIVLSFLLLLVRLRSAQDAVVVIFEGVGLVGVWGYLRGVAVGRRVFWLAYLWVAVVLAVCGIAGLALVWGTPGVERLSFVFAAGVLLAVPEFVAIWRYSHHGRSV